jgi:hypothetical protein
VYKFLDLFAQRQPRSVVKPSALRGKPRVIALSWALPLYLPCDEVSHHVRIVETWAKLAAR